MEYKEKAKEEERKREEKETYLLAVVRNAKKKTELFWYCWLLFETDWRGYSFVLQFKSTVLKKKKNNDVLVR